MVDFRAIKQIRKDEIEIHLDHLYVNQTLPKMITAAEGCLDIGKNCTSNR